MDDGLIVEAQEPLNDARKLLSVPVEEWTRGSAEIAEGIVAAYVDNVPAVLDALEKAQAKLARMEAALRWAHDTLWEINPSNYDHDEVCKLNDASIEVILGIAPLIGETHGKSPEWWAARAALQREG